MSFSQPPIRKNFSIIRGGRRALVIYMPNTAATVANAGGNLYANSSYYPNDTIKLADGAAYTQTTEPAIVNVATTIVSVTPTINAAGSGGTNGFVTLTGTTGTGTKFTANGTITSGALSAINSLISGGAYTVNPTLAGEPVTGGGLTGATLNIGMGVATVTVQPSKGQVTTVPSNPVVQYSSSGNGAGATFTMSYFAAGEL